MSIYGIKKIFQTALTDVASTDVEGVGTIRFEGNNIYKWVRLQNTTATVAVVAGDAVAYDAEDGYQNSQVVSDLSDAGTINVGAGLVMATIAAVAATAYYCWIQIKGTAVAAQAIGGSAADGDGLVVLTTDKVLTRQLFAGTTPNIAANAPRVAISMDSSARIVICDFPF